MYLKCSNMYVLHIQIINSLRSFVRNCRNLVSFPLTRAHLRLDQPHSQCSVAPCGQWLPSWPVQLCSQSQAAPTPRHPLRLAQGQHPGNTALLQPLLCPAFQTSTSASTETTRAPCSRPATICKGGSSALTPSAVRSRTFRSATSKSWLPLGNGHVGEGPGSGGCLKFQEDSWS